QTMALVLLSTSCGWRRPLLYVHITASTKSGVPLGGFFEKNCSPVMPSRNRSSDTGRWPLAERNASDTCCAYSAYSALVMPSPSSTGQTTLFGLEREISCSPSESVTVTVTR